MEIHQSGGITDSLKAEQKANRFLGPINRTFPIGYLIQMSLEESKQRPQV